MSNIFILANFVSNAILPEIEVFEVCRQHVANSQPSLVFFFYDSRVMAALILPYYMGIYPEFFQIQGVYVEGLLIFTF